MTHKKIEGIQEERLHRNWGWLLSFGILFLILGIIGLDLVIQLTLVSMIFFAVLLLLAGIGHLVDVFKHKAWKGALWQSLIAVFYLAAAGVILYDPFLASVLITGMLASMLIVIGLSRIIMAFTLKEARGWIWLLLSGLTAVILGVLILLHWPISGLWIIGLFIAIEMIVTGWTYILIALSLKFGA